VSSAEFGGGGGGDGGLRPVGGRGMTESKSVDSLDLRAGESAEENADDNGGG
jgi:hypothetical protein